MTTTTKYYDVKPFAHTYCSKCFFNGCYPWNRHPFLLCSSMGGLYVAIFIGETVNDFGKPAIAQTSELECLSRKEVDFDAWNIYFKDLKKESELTEEIRLKAMHGKAQSNQVLPAEYANTFLEQLRKDFGVLWEKTRGVLLTNCGECGAGDIDSCKECYMLSIKDFFLTFWRDTLGVHDR